MERRRKGTLLVEMADGLVEMSHDEFQLLLEVEKFQIENGYCPSMRMLMDIIGVQSTSTVANRLSNLQKCGAICKINGKCNAIRSTRVKYVYS